MALWQTLGFVLVGKDSIVAAAGTAGFLLYHTTDDMVDPVLRGAVKDSHCDLHQLRMVYTVVVRLKGPFSPLGLSVLHTMIMEAADLGELMVVGEDEQEDRSDIHAKDLSLVCEGLDGRTVNVQRVDDDREDMVLEEAAVELVARMEFDLDPDDVGTAAAAVAH